MAAGAVPARCCDCECSVCSVQAGIAVLVSASVDERDSLSA